MIENSQPFGALDPVRLVAFEAEIGHSLPPDYRQFLLEHNGGKPTPGDFDFAGDTSGVCEMYGLHDGPTYASLDFHWRNYRGRIPDRLLSICDDPCGNEICICLSGQDRGSIYFWDHESEKLDLVASSFTDFLDKLYEWVDPNEHLFWRLARTDDLGEVQKMLSAGFSLEEEDSYSRTLLENAAIFGRLAMIKLLIQAGAQMRSAIHFAIENQHAELAEYLNTQLANHE